MKISYRWLQEFVETDLAPREIAERLINAGIEVAAINPVVEGLSGVVIAEIEAIERDLGDDAGRSPEQALPGEAPRPDVLRDLWRAERGASACGPPSRHRGRPCPGIGAVKAAVIRGVSSEGMLCSEKELGLSDDHAGILVLPVDAPLGADLATYLGLDDWILEIEITPNRPDALSVVGVAREISALTGAPFRFPQVAVKEGEADAASLAAVEIEAPDLCPRFCARVITGSHGAPLAAVAGAAAPRGRVAPDQQPGRRDQLRHVGAGSAAPRLRLGHGRPAHDRGATRAGRGANHHARWAGPRARARHGHGGDPERALAVGGVMGGAESEVTDRTSTVLLEAAYWDPGSIRRTSRDPRARHRRGLSLRAGRRHRRGERGARPGRPAHGRPWRGDGGARDAGCVSGAEGSSTDHPQALQSGAPHRGLPGAERGGAHPAGARLRRRRLRGRSPGDRAELQARHLPGGRPRRGGHPHLGV